MEKDKTGYLIIAGIGAACFAAGFLAGRGAGATQAKLEVLEMLLTRI